MIKKSQLNLLLIQIEGTVTTTEPDGTKKDTHIGLMNEETNLGLKRKLRKIQKELLDHFNQLKADVEEVNKIEDAEKKKEELERLINETVELKSEKALMSEIEKINSAFAYDFELIELISQ